jgi:putative methionine-R-sulfoxide reductase with GAF domain
METPGTKQEETYSDLKPATGERRRRVRHKVHTPAYASLNGNSTGMVLDLSEILDISEDGVSILASPAPPVNQDVNLCLDLSETKGFIYTTGHVVWTDQSGRTGIRFPEMAETSRRQLQEWLFLNSMVASANHATQPPPLEAEAPAPPDYTSVLAGLAAVKREVAAIGPDLDTALQLIAERALVFTRATGAAIALSQGPEMICVASAGSDTPPIGTRLQVGEGFSGECARSGRLLRCDDSETDPRVDPESCRALGIRAMVAVPIRVGEQVLGLLEVFSPTANAFNKNDDVALQRLAETVLAAVNRATHVEAPAADSDASTSEDPSDSAEILAMPSAWAWVHRAILVVAAATLAFVLLWVLIPRLRTQPVNSQAAPPTKPQEVASQTPTVQEVPTDLGGLRKLAEHGDAAAQFAVGAKYATGEDVPQDYTEAIRWFSMAAEQGHVISQATLGAYYWAGRGVPQDLGKAYFWSVLAQAGGDQASKYRVAVLASRMSRAQVLAAQQQANDWIKQHQLASNLPAPQRQ